MWSTRAIEAHRLLEIYLSHRLTGARRYGATLSSSPPKACRFSGRTARRIAGRFMSPQTSAAIAAAGATATYRGVWPAPFSSVARPPGNVASGWPLHRLPGDGGSRERPVLPLPAGGGDTSGCGAASHRGAPCHRRLKPSGSPASATPHAWPIPGCRYRPLSPRPS